MRRGAKKYAHLDAKAIVLHYWVLEEMGLRLERRWEKMGLFQSDVCENHGMYQDTLDIL
jgi:hypothetical protein